MIEDGGTLSGDYDGDVICDGGVSITNDVYIRGTLNTQNGVCSNNGYALRVDGDWLAQDIEFGIKNTTEQRDIIINGDLIFRNATIAMNADSPRIIINGDLIGYDHSDDDRDFDISGLDGNSGGRMVVYGNVNVYNLISDGGVATDVLNAGGGGDITIYGNCRARDIYMRGGAALGVPSNAGNGGNLEIRGDLYCDDIRMQGGDANNAGNAGDGGTLNVDGDIFTDVVDLFGGLCDSTSHLFRAGRGGYIFCEGTFTGDDVSLVGGERSGVLSQSGTEMSAQGGIFDCNGNVFVNSLNLSGGDVYTSNFAPHEGGEGGNLYCDGNLHVGQLTLDGGYGSVRNGGAGSQNVYIDGNLQVDDLYGRGGHSAGANAGRAAQVRVKGDIHVTNIYLAGGNAEVPAGVSGGEGGVIETLGTIYVKQNFFLQGGDCYTDLNGAIAGSGGSVNAFSILSNGSLNLSAGVHGNSSVVPRDGAETVMNGGSLQTIGDISAVDIFLSGGISNAGAGANVGGNGGLLSVGGNLTLSGLCRAMGGDANGRLGGKGGSISVRGFARAAEFNTSGGASLFSPNGGGGDQTTGGSPGDINLYGGALGQTLYMVDGSGATEPADSAYLNVSGNVTFFTISIANRPNVQLRPDSNTLTTLRVGVMFGKPTLSSSAGIETGNITGISADSVFMSTATGDWVYIQGATIP